MNATPVRKPLSSTSNLLTLSEAPSPAVPSATTAARVNPPADEVGTMILEVDEEILDVGEENKLDALPLKEFVVATKLVVDNVLVGIVPVEPAVTVDLISEQSCALDDLLEPELGQEHSSDLKHEDGKQCPFGQTYPYEVEPHFMAKARVMKTMFSNLMDEERQRVVKIYERSDLGETTPARTIYNNRDLQSYAWAWVFIIQQFEPIAIFGKSYVQVDGMEDRIFDPGAFVGFGVIRIPYSVVASGGGLKAASATWNSRVSCLTQLGKDGEPFLLFRQMLSCGAIPSARCITTLLAACSSRLMQSYRKEIHVLAARREVSDDAGNGGDFAGNASGIEKNMSEFDNYEENFVDVRRLWVKNGMADLMCDNDGSGDPMALPKFLDGEVYELVGESSISTLGIDLADRAGCHSIGMINAELSFIWRIVGRLLIIEANIQGSHTAMFTASAVYEASHNYLLDIFLLDPSDVSKQKAASGDLQVVLHKVLVLDLDEFDNDVSIWRNWIVVVANLCETTSIRDDESENPGVEANLSLTFGRAEECLDIQLIEMASVCVREPALEESYVAASHSQLLASVPQLQLYTCCAINRDDWPMEVNSSHLISFGSTTNDDSPILHSKSTKRMEYATRSSDLVNISPSIVNLHTAITNSIIKVCCVRLISGLPDDNKDINSECVFHDSKGTYSSVDQTGVNHSREFDDLDVKFIGDVVCLEDGSYWLFGKVQSIEPHFGEWYYLACKTCVKKVKVLDDKKFRCDFCIKNYDIAVKRFRFVVNIVDDTSNASLLL
ncbi:hypothetical protein SASPL_101997 [Salvia splendens]|uniref:Uncharacterized protein n=1 Tax=Salvia splendens TaxID=180675 RepID=A0A8X8YWQ1_SALSN|nr:hypothetical protein SASPL_101997 [Salvia splendens]